METSYVIGLVLATAHAVLIGYIVWLIHYANEPVWPNYWLIPYLVDFPASLLCGVVVRLLPDNVRRKPGTAKMFDISNFLIPFIFLGVGGTVWWFVLPQGIAWMWRTLVG